MSEFQNSVYILGSPGRLRTLLLAVSTLQQSNCKFTHKHYGTLMMSLYSSRTGWKDCWQCSFCVQLQSSI